MHRYVPESEYCVFTIYMLPLAMRLRLASLSKSIKLPLCFQATVAVGTDKGAWHMRTAILESGATESCGSLVKLNSISGEDNYIEL